MMLAWWIEACKKNGLPEDTPCPFFAKAAVATPAAPTEDELRHDSQRNLNPNNKSKGGNNAR